MLRFFFKSGEVSVNFLKMIKNSGAFLKMTWNVDFLKIRGNVGIGLGDLLKEKLQI